MLCAWPLLCINLLNSLVLDNSTVVISEIIVSNVCNVTDYALRYWILCCYISQDIKQNAIYTGHQAVLIPECDWLSNLSSMLCLFNLGSY